MRHVIPAALVTVLAGCSAPAPDAAPMLVRYAFRDPTGFVASVSLPDPLPRESFGFTFRGPDGELEGRFEYARQGAADCYFAKAMPVICTRAPGTGEQMPESISDGSRLTIEQRGAETRYVVDGQSFADFHGAALQRFGLLGSGAFYDRTPQ